MKDHERLGSCWLRGYGWWSWCTSTSNHLTSGLAKMGALEAAVLTAFRVDCVRLPCFQVPAGTLSKSNLPVARCGLARQSPLVHGDNPVMRVQESLQGRPSSGCSAPPQG